MKKLIPLFLLLSACATSYQKMGFSGGYDDRKVGDGLYEVSASGNGYTSRSKVQDIVLRRCAELTLENGYDYFLTIDKDGGSRTNYVNQGTQGTLTPNYYGGYNYTARPTGYTVTRHDNTATIKLFKKGEQPEFAYSAVDVLRSMGVEFFPTQGPRAPSAAP